MLALGLHTLLCAKTTFHQLQLEIRTGLPLALGEGQTVLVHKPRDLREIATYCGVRTMEQLHKGQHRFSYDTVEVLYASTSSNGFTWVFQPAVHSQTSQDSEFTVSTLFYLMKEADCRGATSIVIPFLPLDEGESLVHADSAKLHLQAYIVYAQHGNPQHLTKVVFVPHNNVVQTFASELLELAHVFSDLEYFGTIEEQAKATGQIVCMRCYKPRPRQNSYQESETVCEYCILRLDIQPYMQHPNISKRIRCELCHDYSLEPSHQCRLICSGCANRNHVTHDRCVCLKITAS